MMFVVLLSFAVGAAKIFLAIKNLFGTAGLKRPETLALGGLGSRLNFVRWSISLLVYPACTLLS